MDILAARKKAAERAKAPRPAEQPPVTETTGQEHIPAQEPVAPHPEPEQATVDAPPIVLPPAPEPVPEEISETAAYAEEPAPAPSAEVEQDLEMLSVQLGPEEYAVPVERVREVLTVREITPVPHAPEYILGVSSLRGSVLPIIDLKQRLGIRRTEIDEKTRIVVAGIEDDDRVGLLVDRVRGVVRFPASAVRPVPETVEQGAEFLSGIVRQDDRLIIVLDVFKATAS